MFFDIGSSLSVPFSEVDTHGHPENATGPGICSASRVGFSIYIDFVLLDLVGAKHYEQ